MKSLPGHKTTTNIEVTHTNKQITVFLFYIDMYVWVCAACQLRYQLQKLQMPKVITYCYLTIIHMTLSVVVKKKEK